MEKIHIRFTNEEAVSGKVNLLSTEVNALELLKRFNNYKTLRRRELILKKALKKEFHDISSAISKIEESLPTEDTEEDIKIKRKRIKRPKKTNKRQKQIQSELDEIKEKLAKLQ